MRKSWDEHFLIVAREVASMGTCTRRQVGCVLVDERNVILATGFNGVPGGWEHCRDNPGHECAGAVSASGTNLDACLANHSEVNALLHCADVMRAKTCYCTTSPCVSCVKALLCSGVSRIVFLEEYPHEASKELWTRYSLLSRQRTGLIAEHRTWEKWNLDERKIVVIASSGLR
jgi:dCMP deaminase